MITCVCKYTPFELFAGFGETVEVLDEMQADFGEADRVAHANLCGFGKAVIQAIITRGINELVLVNCCDVMRRVYDIVESLGVCDFLFLMDLPHASGCCEAEKLGREIARLRSSYAVYSGKEFDPRAFIEAFDSAPGVSHDYIGILGVRAGQQLEEMIVEHTPLPVKNLTCTGNRSLTCDLPELERAAEAADFDTLDRLYAQGLLGQVPCCRMHDVVGRRKLTEDPSLKGVIYHTIKFCDFYGFEFAELEGTLSVPLVKLETDFSAQSAGQLETRVDAFAETLTGDVITDMADSTNPNGRYVAGIDSGSTSTDVVIVDETRKVVSSAIIPTGGGAQLSAESALTQALEQGGISRSDIGRIVATGYGRSHINEGDDSVTEITCHAKGAHALDPSIRTIIDIGGQDNKVIAVDAQGGVKNFAMNDKCAAGTGRFLEMMARTLGLSLEEMSVKGLNWKKDITISSMCSVFAESEVVSLVAQSESIPDIIHGLNNSVASKIASMSRRIDMEGSYIITGGVSKNPGVVKAIEEKLGIELIVSDSSQLCGALGAALFAADKQWSRS